MHNKTFGERLKELRKERNLSQRELAEKLSFDKSVISRLENGEREPHYAQVRLLCEALCVSVNELLKNTMIGEKEMISKLPINNEEKAKTIEYEGLDDVYAGYMTFYEDETLAIREFEANMTKHCSLCYLPFKLLSEGAPEAEVKKILAMVDEIMKEDPVEKEEDENWWADNQFYVLVHPENGSVKGLRSFGRNYVSGSELLFLTGYLPVCVMSHKSKESFKESIEFAKKQYNEELIAAKQEARYKRPLLVVGHKSDNDYYALDVSALEKGGNIANAQVIIHDYKQYREQFIISKCPNSSEEEILDGHGYFVHFPSVEALHRMELTMRPYPGLWKYPMKWDLWEEREERKPLLKENQVGQEGMTIYLNAISTVNKKRKKEYPKVKTSVNRYPEVDDEFILLELWLDDLEKTAGNPKNKYRLEKIPELTSIIEKTIKEIEDAIK